jgi:hypothetical protein
MNYSSFLLFLLFSFRLTSGHSLPETFAPLPIPADNTQTTETTGTAALVSDAKQAATRHLLSRRRLGAEALAFNQIWRPFRLRGHNQGKNGKNSEVDPYQFQDENQQGNNNNLDFYPIIVDDPTEDPAGIKGRHSLLVIFGQSYFAPGSTVNIGTSDNQEAARVYIYRLGFGETRKSSSFIQHGKGQFFLALPGVYKFPLRGTSGTLGTEKYPCALQYDVEPTDRDTVNRGGQWYGLGLWCNQNSGQGELSMDLAPDWSYENDVNHDTCNSPGRDPHRENNVPSYQRFCRCLPRESFQLQFEVMCRNEKCKEYEIQLKVMYAPDEDDIYYSCFQGYYLSDDNCFSCPAGYFQDEDAQSNCKTCGPGEWNDLASQTSCKHCPKGFIATPEASAVGARYCTSCSKGTYTNETQQTECKECPGGFYLEPDGSSQDSITQCISCPSGFYVPNSGSGECFACSSQANEGQTTCDLCAIGKYTSDTSAACINCPEGYFAIVAGSSECTVCAIGYYQDQTIAGLDYKFNCKECPVGKYSVRRDFPDTIPLSPDATCKNCDAGKYQPNLAQLSESKCKNCPVGRWSNQAGMGSESNCVSCLSGKYSFTLGADVETVCIDCFRGKYSTTIGASNIADCLSCPKGE